jgi:hypothetical protein
MAAFNADGSGTVGVTFPSEIGALTLATQKVRVKNYSSTPKTISLAIDTVVDNPGVAFSLPGGSSLTLLGNQALDIDVQMTGQANLVTHTFDPTIYLVQNGNPRAWMTEETANLTLNAGAGNVLRVPLYVAPYGASTMSGGASVPTGGLGSGNATINLTGVGICTGTVVAGPSCSGNFPITEESLVTPFEWQANNPRNPSVAAADNVRFAGVSTDGSTASFGISLWGPVGQIAAVDNDVEIWIPNATNPQFAVFATYVPDPNALFQNVMVTDVYSFSAGTVSTYFFTNAAAPNQVDTRLFQNDVYFMTVPLSAIGLGPTDTLSYEVLTFNPPTEDLVDDLGPFSFNMAAQGLTFFDSFGDAGGLLLDDLPGAKIPVNFNAANLAANGSLGALLLHHHNKAGSTAEVLTVPPVTVVAPVFQTAVSRRVHGSTGTFDLPLSTVSTNPTTEPRLGPLQTIVFTFDKPVNAATVTVTEGTAVAATPTFTGNDVIVNLSGVNNQQYVTVSLSNVSSADGSSGGTGAVRVGYLACDVNQNRVVTVGDLVLINQQIAHAVTASNYLKDVNASGAISVGDLLLANGHVTQALPAP